MNGKVFILIPTHNRKDLLRACLRCIEKQTYANRETVVIDDGSTDGTDTMLGKEFPNVSLLHGDGNLWWGGAMRQGIDEVLKRGDDSHWILLLNEDTLFDPRYLETIVRVSLRHRRAIVGSTCFQAHNKREVVESGVKMIWERGGHAVLPFPKNAEKKKYTSAIDTLCGRGTLVPLEVFRTIGNFNRFIPHYNSDYEFFVRAKRRGFRLIFSYEAVVYNNALFGGIKMREEMTTLREYFAILFSKGSRSYLIKDLAFVLLAYPPPYRLRQLWNVLKRPPDLLTYVPPFDLLRQPITVRVRDKDYTIVLTRLDKYIAGFIWCLKRRLKGLPC